MTLIYKCFNGIFSFFILVPSVLVISLLNIQDVSATTSDPSDLNPVHRFFNKNTGAYLYTSSADEYFAVLALEDQWNYEGVKYIVNKTQLEGTYPVYRFFNKVRGTHFYTSSESEKADVMKLSDYTYEGIKHYVYLNDGLTTAQATATTNTPVYRFYNPTTGIHLFTISEVEKNSIVQNLSNQWRLEDSTFLAKAAPVTASYPTPLGNSAYCKIINSEVIIYFPEVLNLWGINLVNPGTNKVSGYGPNSYTVDGSLVGRKIIEPVNVANYGFMQLYTTLPGPEMIFNDYEAFPGWYTFIYDLSNFMGAFVVNNPESVTTYEIQDLTCN